MVVIASEFTPSQKLGQPVPESNLVSELNSGAPQQTQWYIPVALLFQYAPVNARSVPPQRATWNCSGVRDCFHSSALRSTGLDGVMVVGTRVDAQPRKR